MGSTTLRFTNPPVAVAPAEFDLGDAGFGSTVTRYITADGGLRPYRFTSDGPLGLPNVIAGYTTTLQMGLSGVLSGLLPAQLLGTNRVPLPFPSTIVTGSQGFRFQVVVRDSKGGIGSAVGAATTGFFNLHLVDTLLEPFRFAMDSVPDAHLGAGYLANLDVVGGRGGLTFSVLSISNTVTGAPLTVDNLGLYLSADGAISGRPLMAGVFALKVRCIDSRRLIAQSRNGLAQDQVFILAVRDQPVTSSDVATLKFMVHGDYSQAGHDGLQYTALVNMLGQSAASLLNSDFSFRFGGLVVAGRLDNKGRFAGFLPDGIAIAKVKVDTVNGLVNISIRNGSFSSVLNSATLSGITLREPVEVTIGDIVAGSEVLDLTVQGYGTRYVLNYSFGSKGSNPAGIFQITRVLGRDGTSLSGLAGDSWLVNFLAAPRLAVKDPLGRRQGFDDFTGATVRIGASFQQALVSAQLVSAASSLSFTGDSISYVKSFKLNTTRFVGRLETRVLSATGLYGTGIPLASQAPQFGPLFFPLGLDLARGPADAPFSGEHGRRIFGLKNRYKDVPPRP
ncbi:MAG: hypothetical protein ABSE73_28585 [Planctomycetota bacterium]